MTDLKIQYLPLSELQGNPLNPKAHDLHVITDSIDRFGIVDVVTRDDRTGLLISGHGRTQVLREMKERGDAPPEGVRVVTPDGWTKGANEADSAGEEWLVPVNTGWSSKDDAEAAAVLIGLNRTTELGGWSETPLAELLQLISESQEPGEDLFVGVGFSQTDLDNLMSELEATASAADEDEVVGIPDEEDSGAEDDGEGDEAASEKPVADDEPLTTAPGAGGGARMVTIKIQDPGLIADWHDHRDLHRSDDDALRALFLGLGPVVANAAASVGSRVTGNGQPRSRVEEPSLADLKLLDDEPEVADPK